MSTLFFSPDAITFLEDRLLWIPRENTIKPSEKGFGDGNRFGTSLQLLQSFEAPIAPPCALLKGKAGGDTIICVILSLLNKIQIGSTWFDCLWFLLIRTLKPSFSQRLMLLDNLEQCLHYNIGNSATFWLRLCVTSELTGGIRRCLPWPRNKDVICLYIKKPGKVFRASVAWKQRDCVTRISDSYKKVLSPLCFEIMLSVIFTVKTVPLNPLFSFFFFFLHNSFCSKRQGKVSWSRLCLLKGFQMVAKCQRIDQTRASSVFACLSLAHCLLSTCSSDGPLARF